jgi:mannose-6-phosphate isomerase-like protein (cupin superfamily)
MKTKTYFIIAASLFLGWCITACNCNHGNETDCKTKTETEVILKDYGAEPTVLDIDSYTITNENFRVALWTGSLLQVTVMSIPVGGEIGLEQHPDTDQFLRIEEGEGKVMMGDKEDELTFVQNAEKDFAIFVPAGKWHNLINTGNKPLKLYSVYAPAEHPYGTIHETFEDDE